MTTDPAAPAGSLGVLGGMGPAATADFLQRLARLTPATRDQDHVPTIVYSDPQTPDRSDAILGRGPSPLPALLRGIEFLNRTGCALIAIPCNSAHYWYEQLAERSAVPVLHIVDATVEQLRPLTGLGAVRAGAARGSAAAVGPVGLMATDGTTRAGIYQERLRAAGIATIDLTDQAGFLLPPPQRARRRRARPLRGRRHEPGRDQANPVMRGIRLMKAGDEAAARATLCAAGEELVRQGAGALVVGCTDISAALAGVTELAGAPVLDAADCLARACHAKLVR